MNPYAEVIAAHAQRAVRLYAAKKDELCKLSRLTFQADGANGATSKADVDRYIAAIEKIGGAVATTSARMAMNAKAAELGVTI